MKRYSISIPATISLVLELDHEPTKEDIGNEVGRFVTLKNGQDFDSDEFEIDWSEDVA